MTTFDLSVVPGFVLAVILILIAPGPDLAYMVAVGLGGGRRAALSAITGICSGMGIYAVIVIAGLGTIVASSPLALTVIKIFGAGYLAWLGIGALRSARTTTKNQRNLALDRWYLRGLLVSLTNPKLLLFFIALLPQFIGEASSPTLQLTLLSVIDILIEFVLYGTVGLFAGSFQSRFADSAKGGRVLHYISAGVYFALATLVVVDLLVQ